MTSPDTEETVATPTSVQDLARLIRPLVDGSSPHARSSGDYLTDGVTDELPPYIQEVMVACGDILILNGRCADHARCEELKALTGCHVGPGETDSFGWLSAVLYTPSGMVVFG